MSRILVHPRPAVHLVLFHTEGEPHDHGKDLRAGAQQLADAAVGHFSSVRVFTPRQLLSRGERWQDILRDVSPLITSHPLFSEDLRWNPQWARIGLLRWKPELISSVLDGSDVTPGDIVFYHDADVERYPDYLYGIPRWASWLSRKMRQLDLLTFDDNQAPLLSDSKPELVERLVGMDAAHHLSHVWAGAVAVKKTDAGRSAIAQWAALCADANNLLPVTRAKRDSQLAQHSADQAVLSCLWHSPDLLGSEIRRERVFLHRSRRIPPPGPRVVQLRRIRRRGEKLLRRWLVGLGIKRP